jgi:presenilin-like A22 family membrane protease
MLSKTLKIIPFVAVIINGLLSCFYLGYDKGYEEAFKLYNTSSLFSTSDGFYQELFQIHYVLTLCLSAFIIGKFLRKEILSHIICLAALLGTFFVYLRWSSRLIINTEFTFLTNLQNTASVYDGVSLVLTIILLSHQGIIGFQYLFYKNRNTLTTF